MILSFKHHYSLNRLSLPGLSVTQVKATDRDANSPNNLISYSLDTFSETKFSIDNTTGQLSVKGSLDYEDIPSYHITVTARDNGKQELYDTATIDVSIIDENDSPPTISPVS